MLAAARLGLQYAAPAIVFNVENLADASKQTGNGARYILSNRHFKLRKNPELAVIRFVNAAFSVLVVRNEAGDGVGSFCGVSNEQEIDGSWNRELVASLVVLYEQFGVCSRSIEK
jgi:hypothetical protein